jgi:spore coat protein CotF
MNANDRDMCLDLLADKKVAATELTKAASECSSQQLRQTLIQMRNSCEQDQMRIGQLATQKGWYLPADKCDQQQLQRVEQYYHASANASMQSGPSMMGAGMMTQTTVNNSPTTRQ